MRLESNSHDILTLALIVHMAIYIADNLLAVRFGIKFMAALVLVTALLQAPGDSSLGQTNCGFLTIEQCRATVSGIGGFCVINQFYNPQGPAKGIRKRRGVRAYEMPYDPYPWCAKYGNK
jgi:hypothetical protein